MPVKYDFEIHTGDEAGAGTDSNIFVQLVGERGITNEVRLNGHISGDAFERNRTDRFAAPFDRDVGDIYLIKLRSDMRYAGAAWLLDKIKVRFVRSTAEQLYRDFTEFHVAQWIKDTNLKEFYATHGFRKQAEPLDEEWQEFLGAPRHLPPNHSDRDVEQSLQVRDEWGVEFTLDVTRATSFSLGTKVEADYEWVKTALEATLKTEIETRTGYKWGRKLTFDERYTIVVPPHTSDMTVREVWSQRVVPVRLALGDSCLEGSSQRDQRRFSGFVEAATGRRLLAVDREVA